MKVKLSSLHIGIDETDLIWWRQLGYKAWVDADDDGRHEDDYACPAELVKSSASSYHLCYRLKGHDGEHMEILVDWDTIDQISGEFAYRVANRWTD